MAGFVKFLLLALIAVAAGVAAVSVPVEGRTVAEHVRALLDDDAPAPARKREAAPRMARKQALRQASDRPPADAPTDEDRAALEKLIGERVR